MAAPYDGKAPGENTALAGVDEEVVEEDEKVDNTEALIVGQDFSCCPDLNTVYEQV